MVKADGGNDRKERLADVCRVKAPAKAGFYDGKIDIFSCKVEQGKRCGIFKKGKGRGLGTLQGRRSRKGSCDILKGAIILPSI